MNAARWRCRIGRIRPHNGGAVVRVIDPVRDRQIVPIESRMAKELQWTRDAFPGGTIGYVLVAWDRSGAARISYEIGIASPIPLRLIPAYVHDRIQEEICDQSAREIAHDVLDERTR